MEYIKTKYVTIIIVFSNPATNILHLGLQSGQQVADLGAGGGAYTEAAAKLVAPAGKVFAVELQRLLVSKLEAHLRDKHITNVQVVWGDIETSRGTRLRDVSVDAVIIANTLFQCKDTVGVIREAKRILKPGGKMLIIDWKDSFNNMGPDPKHILSPETLQDILRAEGLVAASCDVGDHHYGFIINV